MNARPPMVDRAGFPTSSHPESLTADLPWPSEAWLARLARALWPADEYIAIVQAHARRIGGTP